MGLSKNTIFDCLMKSIKIKKNVSTLGARLRNCLLLSRSKITYFNEPQRREVHEERGEEDR